MRGSGGRSKGVEEFDGGRARCFAPFCALGDGIFLGDQIQDLKFACHDVCNCVFCDVGAFRQCIFCFANFRSAHGWLAEKDFMGRVHDFSGLHVFQFQNFANFGV